MKNVMYSGLIAVGAMAMAGCVHEAQTRTGDEISETPSYTEQHRPQLHFTPPTHWMNDPNGMVFFDGEYHLFYQHNPNDTVWGPMHWGHAISTDLIHWEHQPIALYPDELGTIFSGSAVVDWNNTSGFGDGDQPPLVAIYTNHSHERQDAGSPDWETQSIAYSTNKGRTWTKYESNPVLPNPGGVPDFRDPKVFWHPDSAKWVMSLAVDDHVAFYSSPDLKDWTHLSDFGEGVGAHGGVWECPDLFPIVVEETGETKWVLILGLSPSGGPQGGSGTQYFVGDFDGTTFTLDPVFAETLKEHDVVWLDWGADNYAGVTWSDVPQEDGRRIFIGWMSNWAYANETPTDVWRSAMTLPRSLTLHHTDDGLHLRANPVEELNRLKSDTIIVDPRMVSEGAVLDVPPLAARQGDIQVTFRQLSEGARVGLTFSNDRGETYRVGYDAASGRYFSDRTQASENAFSDRFGTDVHYAPRVSSSDLVDMRIVVDTASAELFADGGATVMTDTFFPSEPFDTVAVFVEGGEVNFLDGTVTVLERIWLAR